MSNAYYAPGEQRPARVQALFARIARRYDLLNDLQSLGLHRRWKRRAIGMAGVNSTCAALDVCCGTGDLSFGLAAQGARVTGLDFSREMLEVAQNRQRQRTGAPDLVESIVFQQGDAQALPFGDGNFDAVMVGYGLRNLADWKKGLAEMVRVAKPGGRIVVLDFGKPENSVWRFVYFSYLRLLVPLLGLVFCGDAGAYGYILESLRHYPAQHGVETEMKQLGLSQVKIVRFLGGAMTINFGVKPSSVSV